MRFSGVVVMLAALTALTVGAPHTNAHDVEVDIQGLSRTVQLLHDHINLLGQTGFNPMNMVADNSAIIKDLDHLATDAAAAKSFTIAEASTIITTTEGVARKFGEASKTIISKKSLIPLILHPLVAKYLHEIIAHAKVAGDALIRGCPPDKRAEADKVYSAIRGALGAAANSFSS